MPNGRCRMHGGKQASGLAHHATVSGRYSKYLPTRLLSGYQEAIADPELLALRDDIGLLDTRLGQVVTALNTGESQEAWSAVFALTSQLEQEWQTLLDDGEPPETMESTVSKLVETVRAGLSQGYVWGEIRGLLKERSALVAGEQKRLVDLQQYVSAERALLFVQSVTASVKTHVSDPAILAAIAADLSRLSDVHDGRELAAAVTGGESR